MHTKSLMCFLIFIMIGQAAQANDYKLMGFKSMVSKKAPEKVQVYIEDKEKGTCKVQGAIKTPALLKLMAKGEPEFIGVHGDCNLAGFRFKGPRTFWFHIDNVKITNEVEWEAYLMQIGPNIECANATTTASLASNSKIKSASSLGFCGG